MDALTVRNSLGTRLSLYVTLIAVAAILLVSGALLVREYRDEVSSIDTYLEEIRTGHLPGLTYAHWDLSEMRVESALSAIRARQHVYRARILESRGQSELAGDTDVMRVEYFDLEHPVGGRIGVLEVAFSRSSIIASTLHESQTLVLFLIPLGVMAFSLMLLFNTLIGRPLRTLANRLGEMSMDTLDEEFHCTGRVGRMEGDELDRLVISIDNMRLNLKSEAARRVATENKYHAVFHATSDALFIHDVDGRLIDVNQQMLSMFNCTREQAMSLKPEDTSVVEDGYTVEEALKRMQLALDGQDQVFEWHCKTLEGVKFWTEVALHAAVLDGKQRVVASVRDISERKLAERALRSSEAQFRAIFEGAGEAFLISGDKGTRFCNQRALDMFACTAEELLSVRGPDFSVPVQPDGRVSAEVRKEYFSRAKEGERVSFDWLHRRKDGATFPAEVTITSFETSDEKYLLSIVKDISERAKLEEQYRQAQKMEAVGVLAGGVAHDFNNILQAINGFSEMVLAELSNDSKVRNMVNEIATAGKRAASLVRQLLAFSRRQVLEMKLLDLNDVVDDMLKMVRRVIGEHIELEWRAGRELGLVNADPGQIEQILLNLCVNARDAMPDGGRIVIETGRIVLTESDCRHSPQLNPGDYVQLKVSDTGCGIDEETQANIFDPFFTTKSVGQGTGLGLSTVYGLVKQHNGLIDIESEQGRGTTFFIYLPRAEGQAERKLEREKEQLPSGSETILLAEDDDTVRRLSKTLLETAGYTVIIARDGQEAIHQFHQRGSEIDLAVVDVIMPRMSGRAVWEEVHKVNPDLPFVFASGYSMEELSNRFVLDPGVTLIQKPFLREQFLKTVRDALDASPQSD